MVPSTVMVSVTVLTLVVMVLGMVEAQIVGTPVLFPGHEGLPA